MAQSRAGDLQRITMVGIVGTACALQLQRDGHQVSLLDQAGIGEGCSFGNAGIRHADGTLPVIDRSERYRNVFFAFGHGHLGMTARPARPA